MLIEIDDSAIAGALAGGARSRDCIDHLLDAHRTGKHVVCLTREQMSRLQPLVEADRRARGALQGIRGQENEIRGLRDRVRWRMKVGLGPAFTGAVVTEAGKDIIHVDLHHFDQDERSGRAVLLGENLSDTGLYVTMGKAFAAAIRWRVALSFDERLGGGDTTVKVLQQLIDQGKIVLAIADSDHTHPGGPTGATAAKLLPIARSSFQHVHVLHVRSAENLIASSIYQEAFTDPSDKPTLRVWQRKLDALERLKQAETRLPAHAFRAHADIKDGIKLSQVQAMNAGPEKTFWLAVAGELQRDSCQQPQACAALQSCGCYVTDALGRDALELAVSWLKRSDPRRNAKLLGLAPGTALGDLCERVLAWGLALSARPT